MKIIQGALSLIVLERAAAADGRLRKPGHSTVAKRMAPADASLPGDGAGLEESEFWSKKKKDSGDMSMPASDECGWHQKECEGGECIAKWKTCSGECPFHKKECEDGTCVSYREGCPGEEGCGWHEKECDD